MKYENPIIRGFNPDPSICKANGHYYLVCSSFQYFPGVPLFESTDLINWSQIGCVLTRESQLPLQGASSNGGIYAPTIRYHKGRFYMVTTNVSGCGNFYVWTDDIYGEWSDPIPVDQEGIDPSLYFEGDTCYFMSNHTDETGRMVIMQCEIEIETGKILSEQRAIWTGVGGRYLEAPHLYKIDDTYYLMAAEGGTEYGHMVVYAKGKSPYGPFEEAPNNPVITNRNKGNYSLQGVGHADLVCDDNGNWWMVHLAFRQQDSFVMYHHMGREVCLVPVTFDEDGWMHAGTNGECLLTVETDRLPEELVQNLRGWFTFYNTEIGKEWVYLRNPKRENYEWIGASVRLRGTKATLSETEESPTFLGIRQQELEGELWTRVEPQEGEGGITLYMDEHHHYELGLRKSKHRIRVIIRRCVGDIHWVQENIGLGNVEGPITLFVHISPYEYEFEVAYDGKRMRIGTAQSRYLSSEVAGGFTGVMLGLYAWAEQPDCWWEFKDFAYETKR